MRTPIIAGNWKMNTTVEQAVELTRTMLPDLTHTRGVEVVLCPPFVSIDALRRLIAEQPVGLGAQNMYFEPKGAYTGEISPAMLRPLCEYVILGHSERRQYFGETDELINKKVGTALGHGLIPIFCVGERLEERDAGRTEEVVSRQVRGGLAGIADLGPTVVAYEPVWAIGTGIAATGEDANRTIGLIRSIVADLYGAAVAGAIRIQYGGSVTPANIAEFISQPEIDGGLVGGASLKAADFVSIVRQTAEIKAKP